MSEEGLVGLGLGNYNNAQDSKSKQSTKNENTLENILRKKLMDKFCKVELLAWNVTDESNKSVNINDIYVDLFCVPYPKMNSDNTSIKCLQRFQKFDNNIVVLGLPGCGKSSLIKRLFYECLNRGFINVDGIYSIPIFVVLKHEFKISVSPFCEITKQNNIINNLNDYVQKRLNQLTSNGNLGTRLYKQINDENADIKYFIFCDGLDEISLEQSSQFNRTVASISDLDYVKFYISSRYQGFKLSDYSDDKFQRFSLLDFGIDQEKEYVEKFFNQLDESQSEHKQTLLMKLLHDHHLYEIAKSPILLSLLCISNDLNSIKDRTELFDRAITKLLERRGIKDENTINEIEKFLQSIAVSFFKQDRLENFEKEEVSFYLKGHEIFLKCGLFDEDDNGNIKFHHRTIWEYLVAKGMLDGEHKNEIYERANMTVWAVPIRMWVLMFTKTHTKKDIYEMFCELWKRNKALTLECLSEYPNSSEILDNLYKSMNKKQKLRLISSLRDAYINAPDYKEQAVNTIVKSLSLIHEIEKASGKDCEVIYEYVSFLEEFSKEVEFFKLLNVILEYETLETRLEKLKRAGLKFISLKAGAFEMGRDKFSIPEGSNRTKFISIDEEEVPKHKVRISQDFEMSQTLITNEMYYLCGFPFASNTHNMDSNTGKFKNSYCGEKGHPVNYITWYEAIIFAKWLKCTLPSEAEWEYACRGYGNDNQLNEDNMCIVMEQDKLREYLRGGKGNDNDYPIMKAHYSYAGNTTMPRLIFEQNEREISVNDIRCNSLGLVDMLGNLREWCLDWFGEDFYKKCDASFYHNFLNDIGERDKITYYFNEENIPCILNEGEYINVDTYTFDKDGFCIDPVKQYVDLTESKCIRGGCFDWNVTNLRPTYRNHNPATNVYKVNGFRIIRKKIKGD